MNWITLRILQWEASLVDLVIPMVLASGFVPKSIEVGLGTRLRFRVRRWAWLLDGRNVRLSHDQLLQLAEAGCDNWTSQNLSESDWRRSVFTGDGAARRLVGCYTGLGGRFPVVALPPTDPGSGGGLRFIRNSIATYVIHKGLDWMLETVFWTSNAPPEQPPPVELLWTAAAQSIVTEPRDSNLAAPAAAL